MYRTLLRLGISFVSVGHRSQLKTYHNRLVMFNGSGGFQIQDLQPPSFVDESSDSSPDQVALASSSSGGSSNELVPINVEVSLSPTDRSLYVAYLRIARMCFTQRGSLKNILIHGVLLLLFVLSFANRVLYLTPIISEGLLLQDSSASFSLQYFFSGVIIPAFLDAVINSALAYVALRMRKNLTRGMETECVRAKFQTGLLSFSTTHAAGIFQTRLTTSFHCNSEHSILRALLSGTSFLSQSTAASF
jgi:hypothetical protein